jgi:glutamyl-tRNA synthetase
VLAAAQAPHGDGPEGAYPGTCRHLGAAARAEREATGRRPSWRVRAGGERVEAVDRLRGPISAVVDDFVVRRADGVAAYQVAVVVDDADQGVEEVVRGHDLVPTTPRQVWLARRLGVPVPVYAHVPLVCGPDGRRLAKRHGAVTLTDLVARGITPPTVLASLAVGLGLAAPGQPVTAVADLLAGFDAAALPHGEWVFDAASLDPAPVTGPS